jgi:hypothetical protein
MTELRIDLSSPIARTTFEMAIPNGNGGEKVGHGSGGVCLLRAAE